MFLLEKFLVITGSSIDKKEIDSLFSFYMPIIGHEAISLYMELFTLLDGCKSSINYTHEELIEILNIKPKTLKEAFLKLEGIGLLKTHKKGKHYIYELVLPLTEKEFLKSTVLSTLFKDSLDKTTLKKRLKRNNNAISLEGYSDVSKKIDEVFKIKSTKKKILEEELDDNINFADSFDLDFVLSSIPSGILNKNQFNKEVKHTILSLSFLYSIDKVDMSSILRSVILPDGGIDIQELKEKARDYYRFENPKQVVSLNVKTKKVPAKTNKEKALLSFKTFTPYEFLYNKTGTNIRKSEKETLEILLMEYQFRPDVINTLISYVLKVNNFKFTKNYVLTVASQWKRAGITTAEDAMEFAEKNFKSKKKNSKKSFYKEEINPSWYEKEVDKETLSENTQEELKSLLK